jgi:glycogen operon protein
MKRPLLHRYATRPGFFLTQDGGADAVVWSENAESMWLSVIEDRSQPSTFADLAFSYAPELNTQDTEETSFFDFAAQHSVVSREIGDYRETLLSMNGPNYGRWFVHLPHAWDGMRYGYRAGGAWNPKSGLRFNPYKFLIDPCAKGIEGSVQHSASLFPYECTMADGVAQGNAFGSMSTQDSLGDVPFSVVVDDRDENKHDDDPDHPHIPWASTLIYELHVKGFTQKAPWLPEGLRGTYAGLADPHTIGYLKELGITSVELLPIFAKQTEPSVKSRGAENYWGYSTLNFFSPEPSYATETARCKGPRAIRQEVIDMVHSLHEAGIEVILDVVYNHSCEGGADGYSLSWRGIDGYSYYRRDATNGGQLIDTTGTGNTFNFMNTHVITAAVDSLRYWAKRIGVDGFRFDLAASLGRLEYDFTPHHPFLYAIRADQLLGNLKLIMEPWDLGGGGWRTGQFGLPFSEWNDHFRDTSRKFWLTDVAKLRSHHQAEIGMQEIATRLCGSSDLFATEPGRGAVASINYVCAHDGFTLADLTRYNTKHNEANGEDNFDGNEVNHSYNCGVEGPTSNPEIILKRQRAVLNLVGTLLLSMGTPMLVAGDEFGRTQQGNNNAYCQDNDISWVDWSWMEEDELSWERQRFEAIKDLISVRTRLEQFHHEAFFTLTSQLGLLKQSSRVQWYLADGTTPNEDDWFNTQQRCFMMRLLSDEHDVIVSINAEVNATDFALPADTEWNLLWSSQPVDLSRQESSRGGVKEVKTAAPSSIQVPELTISLWEQR